MASGFSGGRGLPIKWNVKPAARIDPAALDCVLDEVLRSNPNAPITAINEMGFFVPLPTSVPLIAHKVIQGHATALELIVQEDAKVVVDTWAQAVQQGTAQGVVHLHNNPQQPVTLCYIDARHRHGVFIGVFEMEANLGVLAAFQAAPALKPRVGLVRKSQTAVLIDVDESTTQLLGWSVEEMIGRRTLDFLDAEDHPRAISTWMDMLRAPGDRRRVRLRHRHKDGSWVWFEVTNHNLLNDPAHGYVLTEMVDITDEMAVHDALRAREHLLRRLTDALPIGMFHVDDRRRIVYRNARVASVLGRPHADTLEKQFGGAVPADRARLEQAMNAVLRHGRDRDLEIGIRRRGGGVSRCAVNLRALTSDSGAVTGAIVCVSDVTESVRLREQLEDRATFDVLTRCHNRASILSILEQTLAERDRDQRGTAVIFLDLDGFKNINDTLGHAAGDEFLVEVARRLCAEVRAGDTVGRLGGDEFLVVCRDVESAAGAFEIAERLAAAIEAPEVRLQEQLVQPRASIGVAWTNGPGADSDALVARADAAMYEAKRGRLGYPLLVAA
jgi:diguanylate cyclase (GGDEF)-like protein/PAS domain S-box-containing protein